MSEYRQENQRRNICYETIKKMGVYSVAGAIILAGTGVALISQIADKFFEFNEHLDELQKRFKQSKLIKKLLG